jgi:hypothetical protein
VSQLQFQLDYLDELVNTLLHQADSHRTLSRDLQNRARSAQSVGADGWVVDQVRHASSMLGEHPDLLQRLSGDLRARLDIAHSVADEWNGSQTALRMALTGLAAATTVFFREATSRWTILPASIDSTTAAALKPQAKVGTFDGEPVLYNPMGPGGTNHVEPMDDHYRYPGQCVELIARYFDNRLHVSGSWNLGDSEAASNMMTGNPAGTIAEKNGGPAAPSFGDALVFGPTPGNPYGHTALVDQVGSRSVSFTQQNFHTPDGAYQVTDSIPMTAAHGADGDTYQLRSKGSSGNDYGSVLGWVHAIPWPSLDISTSPIAGESGTVQP